MGLCGGHYWQDRRYSLAPGQKDELLAQQGGCAVCGSPEPGDRRGWVVDHDHATGKVRGVLCNACNLGLGSFRDSTDRLEAAIRYLKAHDVSPLHGDRLVRGRRRRSPRNPTQHSS
jgi:hypothetical protein